MGGRRGQREYCEVLGRLTSDPRTETKKNISKPSKRTKGRKTDESRFARQKIEMPSHTMRQHEYDRRGGLLSTGQSRGDEFREPLPDEDANEDDPEEAKSLLLRENGLVSVERVEEIDGGNKRGEDDVGRVNAEGAHQSGESVSEELRAQQSEYRHTVVWSDSVCRTSQ